MTRTTTFASERVDKIDGGSADIDALPGHRKYAEGKLRHHSFYFRGPDGRLNLRAQNLSMFCQIAEGLDEQTWMFHLRRRDCSRWFRKAVRDEYLAQQAERIELRADLNMAAKPSSHARARQCTLHPAGVGACLLD